MQRAIKNYLSLIKFAHTIFAMPFALIGFFLALRNKGFIIAEPWAYLLLLVILCMIFARSAAMAFNRFLDKKFDALNPRTAIREIPAGIISAKHAFIFVVLNCIAFVVCTFYINLVCFYLSPVALFVILFYSYTKRFTPLSHLVLGLGLSLAPIGAYLAVTGKFNLLPILFSLSVLFWVSGFDIIYALQDEEFDRTNKLRSIPSWLGIKRAMHISEYLHLLSAASLFYAGIYGHFSWFYWAGFAAFVFFLIFQHLLVKPYDLSKINVAFFTANGVASVIFSFLVILDLVIFKN